MNVFKLHEFEKVTDMVKELVTRFSESAGGPILLFLVVKAAHPSPSISQFAVFFYKGNKKKIPIAYVEYNHRFLLKSGSICLVATKVLCHLNRKLLRTSLAMFDNK